MNDVQSAKRATRDAVRKRRAAVADKDAASRRIVQHLQQWPTYQRAGRVLCYVAARDEVRTRPLLAERLQAGVPTAVPYCDGETLQLCWLESLADDLVTGRFGIAEPRLELRGDPQRRADPWQLDMALVPGVAFSLQGQRLGYGRGFFDRLLAKMDPQATLVGLAYDCQLVDELASEPHDVPLAWLITETGIQRCAREP